MCATLVGGVNGWRRGEGTGRMLLLEWVRRWFEIRTYKTSMLLMLLLKYIYHARQNLKPLDLVKHQILLTEQRR